MGVSTQEYMGENSSEKEISEKIESGGISIKINWDSIFSELKGIQKKMNTNEENKGKQEKKLISSKEKLNEVEIRLAKIQKEKIEIEQEIEQCEINLENLAKQSQIWQESQPKFANLMK